MTDSRELTTRNCEKDHIDPRTAKRYAETPQRPEYTLTEPNPSKLNPYKQQIDLWLEEAPYSVVRILEKLTEQGYDGKYSIVRKNVRGKKIYCFLLILGFLRTRYIEFVTDMSTLSATSADIQKKSYTIT